MSGAESAVVDAPARPDPARPRFGRPDPWLLVSCGVALVVYLLHGFDGAFSGDIAIYSYAGQQVAEGHLPYETIINRSGPLAHAVPGLGVWVGRMVGADDVIAMRVLFMVISIVCVGLAYLVGRDLFRWRPAGLAAAAALLSFECFTRYATYGPREKTLLVLFLLALMLALLRGHWFTAGVWISLATLTWQPTFLLGMAGAVVAIVLSLSSGRWRALVRVLVGGLLPAVITVLAYVVAGSLDEFLEAFLLINLEYTKQPTLLDRPTYGWSQTESGFGVSMYGFLAGMVALLALSLRALLAKRHGTDPLRAVLVGSGAMLLVGLLWSVKAFNTWPDTFILMPMAALGIAGLAAWLRERLPARAALAAAMAWVVFATGLAAAYSWTARDTSYPETRAAHEAVLGLLPEDARILGIEAPEVLALAHERNVSRYQLLGAGMIKYLKATWPGGKDGFADWAVDQEPDLVVVGTAPWSAWLAHKLTSDYQVVGKTTKRVWMVPRDLDEETTEQIRSTFEQRFPDA